MLISIEFVEKNAQVKSSVQVECDRYDVVNSNTILIEDGDKKKPSMSKKIKVSGSKVEVRVV